MLDVLPQALVISGLIATWITIRYVRRSPDTSGVGVGCVALMCLGGFSADASEPLGATARTALLLGVACVLLVVARRAADHRPDASRAMGVFFLAFFTCSLWAFSVNVLLAPESPLVPTFGRLAPVAVLASAYVAVRSGYMGRRDMLLAFALALSVAFLWSGLTADPWASCTQFKCGPGGKLFTGAFASENFLGRVASVAILTGFALRAHMRLLLPGLLVGTGCLVLYATGSRTSQLALVVALVAWAAWRATTSQSVKRVVCFALPGIAIVTGLRLIYSAEPDDFSNRGSIWARGVQAIRSDWMVGVGLDNWTADVLARNYMHSEALLLLFSGGAVAVAAFSVMVSAALAGSMHSRGGFPVGAAALVLVSGLVEVTWNPLALDGSLLVVLLLLAGLSVQQGEPEGVGAEQSAGPLKVR